MTYSEADLKILEGFKEESITDNNCNLFREIDSKSLQNKVYKDFISELESTNIELYYKTLKNSNFMGRIPVTKHLKDIVQMPHSLQQEIAWLLFANEKNHPDNTMLQMYLFYISNSKANILFYLEVLNKFKFYTPKYVDLVWSWAKNLNIDQEVKSERMDIGSGIMKTLINSPIHKGECAQWCFKFLEKTIEMKNKNQIFDLKPNVSRAENNLSLEIFNKKDEFISYFGSKGEEFSRLFFMYYYDFSHLFDCKEDYLFTLKKLSGTSWDWPWYGSVNHP